MLDEEAEGREGKNVHACALCPPCSEIYIQLLNYGCSFIFL